MRLAIVVGLVLMGSAAAADPAPETPARWRNRNTNGLFVDVGAGWMRVATSGVTYRAEYVRFAPQISLNRWFYIGAAIQLARIYGSSGTVDGTTAGNHFDETSGSIVEPQVFVGVRDRVGIVSGAIEAAPTVRWTTSATSGLNLDSTASQATIELHARADIWPTPHVSAGLMIGADFNSVHDFEAGLQVGFHFEPYDLMR